jgi:threonine/homoserine/homoserine lactone efflux protein
MPVDCRVVEMRTVFVAYLVVVWGGLAYLLFLGLRHG